MAAPHFTLNSLRVTKFVGSTTIPARQFQFWIAYRGDYDQANALSAVQTVTGGATAAAGIGITAGQMPAVMERAPMGPTAPGSLNLTTYASRPDLAVVALIVKGVRDTTEVSGTIHNEVTGADTPFAVELYGGHKDGSGSCCIVMYRKRADGRLPTAAGETGLTSHVDIAAVFEESTTMAKIDASVAAVGAFEAPRNFRLPSIYKPPDSSKALMDKAARRLYSLGFNIMGMSDSEEVYEPHRLALQQARFTRIQRNVYNPPTYNEQPYADIEGDGTTNLVVVTQAERQKWMDAQATYPVAEGWPATAVQQFHIRDEPAWRPGHPADSANILKRYDGVSAPQFPAQALTDFHTYLQAQGLTPADVGGTAWDNTVTPVGPSQAASGTVGLRRRFYWSMRFFTWQAGLHMGGFNTAAKQSFSAGVDLVNNLANYDGRMFNFGGDIYDQPSPDRSNGNFDILEEGYHNAGTLWFSGWHANVQQWRWIIYATWCRSGTVRGTVDFGAYLMPRADADFTISAVRQAISLVGHGANDLAFYMALPTYVDLDGWTLDVANEQGRTDTMAKAMHMISKTEDLLDASEPLDREVGVVFPKSAQMWDAVQSIITAGLGSTSGLENSQVDYYADAWNILLALAHAGYTADVIDEDDLTATRLADFKVVFCTTPNLKAAHQDALATWTSGGGTLVTTPSAGSKNHDTNDTLTTINALGGIVETTRNRQPLSSLYGMVGLGGITHTSLGTGAAYGDNANYRSVVTNGGGGTVEATFDDNSNPAIINKAVGSNGGRRIHFAFPPGLAYFGSAGWGGFGALPENFSSNVRSWLTRPLTLAGVTKPIVGVPALVESLVRTTTKGWHVSLVNWKNDTTPTGSMSLTANTGAMTVTRVNSYLHGDLSFTTGSGTVSFTHPGMATADVVRIYSNVAAPVVPARPSGTAGFAVGGSIAHVACKASAGATRYEWYRATATGGPYTWVGRSNRNSFLDTGKVLPLAPSTTYYYAVEAGSVAGVSVKSAEIAVTTTAAPANPFTLVQAPFRATNDGLSVQADPWSPATLAGNLLVIVHLIRSTANTAIVNTPAGWTKAGSVAAGLNTATLFYKIAAGGDAAPSVSVTSSARQDIYTYEFSGNDSNLARVLDGFRGKPTIQRFGHSPYLHVPGERDLVLMFFGTDDGLGLPVWGNEFVGGFSRIGSQAWGETATKLTTVAGDVHTEESWTNAGSGVMLAAAFKSTTGSAESYVTLTPSSTAPPEGTPVSLTASVEDLAEVGTATGNVSFYDSTTLLATVALDGTAQASHTFTPSAGGHPLRAVFNGDSAFAKATSPTETVVASGEPPPPTTWSAWGIPMGGS